LLRSVIVNLIDNAAEALENSAYREIVVSTRAHLDAETVEICVSDTGHGISPEDKDKLFFRISPPRIAARAWVLPSPRASWPNTAEASTWRTIFPPARTFAWNFLSPN